MAANETTLTPDELTRMLRAWSDGDETALEKLTPVVYRQLRQLARGQMAKERRDHLLQTTALINEAYVRLIGSQNVTWQDRAHFYSVCARMMRRILVDFARAGRCGKRGGGMQLMSLDEAMIVSPQRGPELLAVHEALERLEAMDPRKSRVVELRFFGGLEVEEVAEVLKVSRRTVINDWNFAKAWLHREIGGEA